ncbi:MAG TPA: hypothetical protein DDZ90_14720, partial [Planctomycetaceae bacterium]|nr:hypothetical protein [Planctomycetaceae bacterium]
MSVFFSRWFFRFVSEKFVGGQQFEFGAGLQDIGSPFFREEVDFVTRGKRRTSAGAGQSFRIELLTGFEVQAIDDADFIDEVGTTLKGEWRAVIGD